MNENLPPDGGATPDPAGATDTTPPPAGPPPAAGGSFFDGMRRLGITRADDRWVAGVCSGVADRLGIDPLVVRAVLGVSILLGGFGLVAYGVAWALLPERRDGRIHLQEMLAGRFDVAVVGAAAFVVVGFGRGSGSPLWWAGPGRTWLHGLLGGIAGLLWFAVVAAVIVGLIVALSRRPPSAGGGVPPRSPGDPVHHRARTAAATTPAGTPAASASATPAPAPAWGTAPTPGSVPPAPPYTTPYPTRPAAGPAYAPAAATGGPTGGPTGAPAAPARPVKERHRPRGAGAASLGIVVALGLLTFAGLLAAHRVDRFDGPVLLTAIGVLVVLAGLGIVVAGLRGRTSGALGTLAVLALLVSLPVGLVAQPTWLWDADRDGRLVSSSTVTPTTRSAAADGLQVGIGDATVDLTDVPLSSDPLTVPVSLGAGNLSVVVPADAAVEANVRVGAGSVRWEVDGAAQELSGVRIERRTFQDEAARDDGAELVLDLSVGVGEITITREDS